MKCIKYIGKVSDWDRKPIRVSDEDAQQLVNTGNFVYCPKHEWKVQER